MNSTWKILSLTLMLAVTVMAAPEQPQTHGDRFLICLEPNLVDLEIDARGVLPVTGLASLDDLFASQAIMAMEPYLPGATADDVDGDVYLKNIYRLKMDASRNSLEAAMSAFADNEFVLYAEPEAINRVEYEPNDPRWYQMWYLERIEADAAWDLWDMGVSMPGSLDIVLASVDTGVKYTHADLMENIWVNQAEVPASIFAAVDANDDGLITATEVDEYVTDYDGNGNANLQDALHSSSPFMDGIDGDDWDNNPNSYVDDLLGWDVAGPTGGVDPDNDPMGSMSGAAWIGYRTHGTNVAGNLAAGTDNGVGISSAVFNGRVMAVKCLVDNDANGSVWSGYTAMLYAAKAGANIINCSWGSFNSYSQSDQSTCNVIYDTYGALIVSSSGNGNDNGTPNDFIHYPSGYDNVVSVTAVGPSDNFSWATYGTTVDLSAPGENISTTTYLTNGNDSYESVLGTSFSSPITASAFGLLKAFNPTRDNDWLVDKMLLGSDDIDEINPDYAGGLGAGRVNVYNAIAMSVFPNLSYNSYSLQMVNDNGDGQLSPGEETKLRVNLFNDPVWLDASDVTATLSSTSPFVDISDAESSYGDINAGNVGIAIVDRFQFSVSPEAPSGNIPFSMVVTANESSANPYTVTIDFEVEVSIWQAFFPVELTGNVLGGNAVVDLDGDGSKDIIFGAGDSMIHAINLDGEELAGFPVVVGSTVDATPSIGDIDNDGDLEIVVGSLDYNLYVIQHDGTHESIFTSGRYIYAAASLYDADGDGDLEIFVPTWDYELLGMQHDGTMLDNFPLALTAERMTSGAAVVDLNGDASPEIIFGTWLNKLHAYQLDGTELAGFPVELGGRLRSAPVVANIDNSADGSLEIILGSDDDVLYCYDTAGQLVWDYTGSSQNIQTAAAVSDMDGDGDSEIIFTSLDRNVYVLDHSGAVLDGFPVETGGAIYSSPVVGDVDGDGMAEMFFGSDDDAIYGLHLDGSLVGGFPVITSANVKGTPTLDDLDLDGDVEVVIGLDGALAVVDIMSGSDLSVHPAYSTDRGNLHRDGFYSASPVSVSDELTLPATVTLHPNYPNPFNPQTNIMYSLPVAQRVSLTVRDIIGREVVVLDQGLRSAGIHTVEWRGVDARGQVMDSGVYFYQLKSEGGVQTAKMIYLK